MSSTFTYLMSFDRLLDEVVRTFLLQACDALTQAVYKKEVCVVKSAPTHRIYN